MIIPIKILVVVILIGANIASIILCFQHYEFNGTVPISYGSDRYRLPKLLAINYQGLIASIFTTATWTIACLMNDFLFTSEDREYAILTEFLFRHVCLLLFDIRIKLLNETSVAGRLSIAFGDAIAVSLIALHSNWHRKQKQR